MILRALIFLLFLPSSYANEKLLDKIVAVINGKIISWAEVQRAKETLDARREISPFIYTDSAYTETELLELMIQSHMVREKTSNIGYVVSDDHVESRIKMTEEKLGLTRESLLEFLKQKKVTYEEYFEIIREAMEYNLFSTRIIGPLLTITEQEIKNEYYKKNQNNKALSFVFDLIDFSLPTFAFKSKDKNEFAQILKDYQISGRLPKEYEGLDSAPIEGVKGENLATELAKVLEVTEEGSFTSAIEISGRLHVFYVKSKNIVESQLYLRVKDQIESELFNSKSKSFTKNWFEREYSNFYIKRFL